MTMPYPCPYCRHPIRKVGGFRQSVEAEPAYFVVEADGPERALTDDGCELSGHFGRVKPGDIWKVGYRPHTCKASAPVEPSGKDAAVKD